MIDKLIEKYKEQKFSNDFAKSSLEALMVNQKLDEILQDLEELKKELETKITTGLEAIDSPYCLPKVQANWLNKIKIYKEILGGTYE